MRASNSTNSANNPAGRASIVRNDPAAAARRRESLKGEVERLVHTSLRYVTVHVTDFCPSKCEFCVVNTPIRQIPIETSTLVDFVKGYKGKDFDILTLHGGEPTVSKALFPVLQAGAEAGFEEFHIQTNGIRLADRGFVRELIGRGIKVFVVSLHGHSARLQEEISLHPRSFTRIMKGIENCLEEGALVRTNTVVCRQNIDRLADVLSLAHDLGVPWMNVSAIHPSEMVQLQFRKLVPSPAEVRDKLPRALSALKESRPDAFFELEGFATCAVPGFEDCHLKKWKRFTQTRYHGVFLEDYWGMMDHKERVKPANVCGGCRHYRRCNGAYIAYLGFFDPPTLWPDPK